MGFEPTTLGTTIRYSNQLSYSHRFLSHRSGLQIYCENQWKSKLHFRKFSVPKKAVLR